MLCSSVAPLSATWIAPDALLRFTMTSHWRPDATHTWQLLRYLTNQFCTNDVPLSPTRLFISCQSIRLQFYVGRKNNKILLWSLGKQYITCTCTCTVSGVSAHLCPSWRHRSCRSSGRGRRWTRIARRTAASCWRCCFAFLCTSPATTPPRSSQLRVTSAYVRDDVT